MTNQPRLLTTPTQPRVSETPPTDTSNPEALPEFRFETGTVVRYDGHFLFPGELADHPQPHMPLLEAIWTRRSTRSYSERPVPRAVFAWLVRQAMNAPTACNEQQWKIIHLDDPALIRDLHERGSASFLTKTRHCFLLCYNRQNDNRPWQDHIQSGAAFVTLFQLVAHTIGIGSCWIGHLPNKSEVRRLFQIPRAYDPVALVAYGYYRQRVKIMPRKHDVAHLLMENRFRAEEVPFKTKRGGWFRIIARWCYYKVPAFLRRRLRALATPYEKKFYYESYD
ncbi:MAG: nitroreductase family protein [Magnetococcales bacterium]|nr:nitroreductase family protein [Magnetococcales bacterium]